MVEDFFVVLFLYPCAANQMYYHVITEGDAYDFGKKHDDFPMKPQNASNDYPHNDYPSTVATAHSDGPPKRNDAYIISEMPRESINL